MKLYKNIDYKHINKMLTKSWSKDAVFMHHTGNMFGIGTPVTSEIGVQRICDLKSRESGKGFVVLVENIDMIIEYVDEINAAQIRLMEQYYPGNLTMVLKCSNPLFKDVSLNGTVAFRVPQNPVLLHFLHCIKIPIVSTSINKSHYPPATSLKDISTNYDNWFDFGFTVKKVYQLSNERPSTIVKFDDTIKCIREGSIPFYELKRSYETSLILFVCTGNVCRSPIAEYLLKKAIERDKLPFRSESTGILQDGMTISANSAALLLVDDIDANSHLSRKITEAQLSESWLVLTMEDRHKEILAKQYPQFAYKVHSLMEFGGESGDIDDPYQKSIEDYKVAYKIIEDKVNYLVRILKDEVNIDD
ncbi:MAG: hypothetical protein B6226_03380 [Candidatus Cloacimonetes bacterium 4572_65]|nr:MAG: hypothetical protein B6226_03380 [Candidatus Cloacimonetes bacterium 4572_65]